MKILRVKTLQEKIYESLELKYKIVTFLLIACNKEEIDKSIVKLGEAKDKLQTLQETYKK